VGRPAGEAIEAAPVEDPDVRSAPDLAALTTRALESRPDLRAARMDVAARDREVDARRRERVPEPSLFVGYARERTVIGASSDTDDLLTARLAIPLPFVRTGTAEVVEAEAQRAAAAARQAALERESRGQVADARARLEAALRQVARYTELEASVERTGELYERGYAEGRISLTDFLAVRDRVRAIRLAALTARRDAALADAALVTATGGSAPGRP
jgi:outer membrane protein TolC